MSKDARRRSRNLGLKKGFRREKGNTPRYRLIQLRIPRLPDRNHRRPADPAEQ